MAAPIQIKPRRDVTFGNLAQMTVQEEQNARWHVLAVAILAGIPAALCLLAVGRMNIAAAGSLTSDPEIQIVSWFGAAAITLAGAGTPVAWRTLREVHPGVARAALWGCLASVALSVCAGVWFVRTGHEPLLEMAAAVPASVEKRLAASRARFQIDAFKLQWPRLDCSAVGTQTQGKLCGELAGLKRELAAAERAERAPELAAPHYAPNTEEPHPGVYVVLAATIAGAYGLTLIASTAIGALLTSKAREFAALLGQGEEDEEEDGEALLVSAANVTMKPINWLWPGIIARSEKDAGCYHLLGGEPGMGKSQVAVYIAAIISSGGAWPDGSKASRGSVAIAENEDARASAILPRLHAAGADVSRVHFVKGLDLSEDTPRLAKELRSLRDLKLLILSPWLDFFGPEDNREVAVRAKLKPLLSWAAKREIAVLGIVHPLKGKGASANVFAGAETFRRLARGTYSLISDPTDKNPNLKARRRLMIAGKVNNAADTLQLPYRIEGVSLPGGIETSRIVFLDPAAPKVPEPMDEDTDDLPLPPIPKDRELSREEAIKWIKATLADGRPRDAKKFKLAAWNAGITTNRLYKLRNAAGATIDAVDGRAEKRWSLPLSVTDTK